MRGGKSFLILLVLAAGLGGYAYFVESKHDPSDVAATKKDKVFTVDSEKIDEITVKAENGDVTKVKKANNTWKIVSPAALDTDPAEVSAITTALAGLESEKVVDANPPSLKEFTLDPPKMSITFHVAGETGTHRIDLGMKTPVGGDLYAKVEGKPAVFLVGAYREDALNKSTFNLRDKTVLVFDRDGANFLKIDDGKKPIVAAKQDNQWQLSQPLAGPADFTAVDGLIGRLYQSRMKSFVADDGTKDLKKYGLDKPQVVVTVGAGSARAQLALGAKTSDGSVYARDLTRPMIFTLEGTLVDDLKKPVGDMRQKDVFDFRTFSALGLDVTRGGQTYSFKAESEPVDGKLGPWKLIKPSDKMLDATKINDLLVNFSSLRADSFIEAPGTGEETVVTARFGTASAPKTETVTFRVIPAKGKDGKVVVHAMRKGEKDAMVVSALDFDKAMAVFKELTGSK